MVSCSASRRASPLLFRAWPQKLICTTFLPDTLPEGTSKDCTGDVHTLSRLYESAVELQLPESAILLESPVVDIDYEDEDGVYKLTTESGSTI